MNTRRILVLAAAGLTAFTVGSTSASGALAWKTAHPQTVQAAAAQSHTVAPEMRIR